MEVSATAEALVAVAAALVDAGHPGEAAGPAVSALSPDLLLALAVESGALTERAALTDGSQPRKHHRFFVATEQM